MDQPTEPTPTDAAPTDAPHAEPQLDLLLEARSKESGGRPLVRIKTVNWLPWTVVLFALVCLVGIAVSAHQAGVRGMKVEMFGSIIMVLVAAAFIWQRLGKAGEYHNRFVFSNPEDVVGFVHFDEAGVRIGMPKVQSTRYAWVYFSDYGFVNQRTLRLIAGSEKIDIDLSRFSDEQRAQLRAGLARVFARPRIGRPIHIRDCMGCGYNLSKCPGPDCPECGRPMHKLNFQGARLTDTAKD